MKIKTKIIEKSIMKIKVHSFQIPLFSENIKSRKRRHGEVREENRLNVLIAFGIQGILVTFPSMEQKTWHLQFKEKFVWLWFQWVQFMVSRLQDKKGMWKGREKWFNSWQSGSWKREERICGQDAPFKVTHPGTLFLQVGPHPQSTFSCELSTASPWSNHTPKAYLLKIFGVHFSSKPLHR